jgi:hypothetical protein
MVASQDEKRPGIAAPFESFESVEALARVFKAVIPAEAGIQN